MKQKQCSDTTQIRSYMYLFILCFDVDVTSSPSARMEVDSVHVVKRIVALLVDSFQPSGLSGAEQVCVCVCECVCECVCVSHTK